MKEIHLGTLFSGIGAIEQALSLMKLKHTIVFACDNGELELKLLPNKEQKEFENLKKIPKNKIKEEDYERLVALSRKEKKIIESIYEEVCSLPSKQEKKKYIDNLYVNKSSGINYVKKSYLANYIINEDNFHLDVHFFDGRDYEGQVDLMVGGSPCQAFSSNGKRGGLDDTRGTLFYEYARIISEVRPKAFIFENVRGMINHDKGRTWETIKNVFQDLNYHIYIHHDEKGKESPVLNAADYGIPQLRMRLYVVGIRNDIKLEKNFSFPQPIELKKTIYDYLEPTVPAKYYLAQKGFEFVTTHPSRAQVGIPVMTCQKANQQFNWNGTFIFEKLDPNKHNEDILSRAYVGMWNGEKGVIRMFTPRECLRLMGFSDSFKIVVDDNKMWRQSGNSIVTNVLQCLMKELINTGVFN